MIFILSSSTPCFDENFSVIRQPFTPATLFTATQAPPPLPQTPMPRSRVHLQSYLPGELQNPGNHHRSLTRCRQNQLLHILPGIAFLPETL